MGFWKKLFIKSDDGETQPQAEDLPVVVETLPAVKLPTELDETDRSVLTILSVMASGIAAEDLGPKVGLEQMLLCLYRLDKLVKDGLVKRNRPMFREPELYEITELGKERMAV